MTSHEIEFLPKKFRERRSRKSINVSRWLVAVVLIAALAVVTLYQLADLHSLNVRLAELDRSHGEVSQLMQQLELKRAEVAAKRQHANLLTFLHYPYPKSQVIATVTNPLPSQITLTRIQITSDVASPSSSNKAAENESAQQTSGPPMQADFTELLKQQRSKRCMVELEGTTEDSSCLYNFVADLHQAEIVDSATLETIDPQKSPDGREISTFTVHVKIKRGHLDEFTRLVGQLVPTANPTGGRL